MMINSVPTNIITGFLGVGKTSTIMHLLDNKPQTERWAVLINEFGDIGIDGALLNGQYSEDNGVFVREVPGGCMCCAAGLPMQIALNQLLKHARPHRLLIEPTGLGHPAEVVQALSAEHYQTALSLQKVTTLVDARKLSDTRYTQHETFKQQIAIADTIVANKRDLCSGQDIDMLHNFVKQNACKGVTVIDATHGNIAISQLDGVIARDGPNANAAIPSAIIMEKADSHRPHNSTELRTAEGFKSIGWRFSPDKVFDRLQLITFLKSLNAERVKAVMITDNGIFGYNRTLDTLSEIELDDAMESRIEIIAATIDATWEQQLLQTSSSD